MAISIRGNAGAWTESTSTTATVTLPTHAAGDMLLVRCLRKPYTSPTDITCGTTGWAAAGTGFANGTTANANGVGSMAVQTFWKVATSASETSPVVTWGTTAAPGATCAVVYQKAAGEAFITPLGVGGTDSTAATTVNDTLPSHVSCTAGDMYDFFAGWCDDIGTPATPSIAQADVAFGTVAIQPSTALDTGTGTDLAAHGGYRLASSGTSTAAAIITAAYGSSEEHIVWATRLRVAAATSPDAGHASGTGAAYAPTLTCASNANAGHASGTGSSYGPTITTGTAAQAGLASGTGGVGSSSTKVEAAGGLSSATGAASAPASSVQPSAGAGAGAGAAASAPPNVQPNAGAAAGAGEALAVAPALDANAAAAEGAGAALDPTVDTSTAGTNAPAGLAAGAGAAFDPTVTGGIPPVPYSGAPVIIDIYLYPEATNRFDIILRHGLSGRRWGWPLEPGSERPVVGGSLYVSLVGQYGDAVGSHMFEAMAEERKGPFAEGAKYDLDKRSVKRKIAKAGGLLPDPLLKLRQQIAKGR